MTASPVASARIASGPLAGDSPNTSAPKIIPASGLATLSTGRDMRSDAYA